MPPKILYTPLWYYDFCSLVGSNGEYRQIDVQREVPGLCSGSVVVYMEVGFDYSQKPARPCYTGKYLVRKVIESIGGFYGLKEGHIAILLKPLDTEPPEIEDTVDKMIDRFNKEGGYIPFPL
jgi:hypothetical protein